MDRETINAEVRALERLDLQGLRLAWRDRYGPAPKLRSPDLLALMLAYRIQAEAFGGLDPATRRKLRAPAKAAKPESRAEVGTVLVREWKGERQMVTAVEGGFVWKGQRFRSLSGVARAITGIRWNGPRFFGLRDEAHG